jgi:hypothetical protein
VSALLLEPALDEPLVDAAEVDSVLLADAV